MNRYNSLTILYDKTWMSQDDWQDEIMKYHIEGAFTPNCPELDNQEVVWLGTYDDEILHTILLHEPAGVVIKNLKAWFDTGSEEVRINENNYLDTDENGLSKYPANEIYCNRKGTYDVTEDCIDGDC